MKDKLSVVLFDSHEIFENLLPLSYTRPVSDFRIGIQTIRSKWESMIPGNYFYLPVDYLQEKYPGPGLDVEEALFISGNVVATRRLAEIVNCLSLGEALFDETGLVAARCSVSDFNNQRFVEKRNLEFSISRIRYVFDLFTLNGDAIREDYARIVKNRESMPLDRSNTLIGAEFQKDGMPSIFIEEGAIVEGAILNVKDGPIYIGRDAHVMEGSALRGPLAVCRNAQVRMGSKIYGNTTIGPWCKVGGEIDNSVLFSYSNKAHDGYLGNAVIGEWCNIGAGSTASNLKNDYSKIRIWNYSTKTFMRTNLLHCGLIMADHSKAGINTMFNTATVIGVGVNLHGSGFPRQFIPSFSNGSPQGGYADVSIDKFFELAKIVMGRRGKDLTETDRKIFHHIYNLADRFK